MREQQRGKKEKQPDTDWRHSLVGSYKYDSVERKQKWDYRAPVMVGQGNTQDLLSWERTLGIGVDGGERRRRE